MVADNNAFTENIPLSLYIHFPWCVKKCPYCDFNSHTLKSEIPEQPYIAALLADLDEILPVLQHSKINSIFMGGGTPSLFSPTAIDTLLQGINKRLMITNHTEITLEANPGTVEYARFKAYRSIGINRLSIGVQSFQADKLHALGRIHDNQQAILAINAAHDAGFSNFNVDVMYGLPKQTLPEAMVDLTTAIDLSPTHISWYHLTLEPNTVFYRQPPANLPDDELIDEIETTGRALLQQRGFCRYEVSAYAKAGCQAAHNLNYWQFGDYIGIGAGAHGKLTNTHTGLITRTCKQRVPANYLDANRPFTSNQWPLSPEDKSLEFMLNALRLTEGFVESLFSYHTGLPLAAIAPQLAQAMAQGLMERQSGMLRATPLGQRFLNDLVALFDKECIK